MPNNPDAASNLTPFAEGQSGNVHGRPKGPITQFLREFGDADELVFTIIKTKDGKTSDPVVAKLSTGGTMSINQSIAARLLQLALSGDMKAIREVLNRTEGRVPQPINLGGADGGPVVFYELPKKQSHE